MYKFCYISRLTIRQKRSDLLIKFCRALNENEVKFTIDIYGDGDTKIKNLIKSYAYINYHGFTTDWINKLDENHVFLSFSDYEGCPLSLLEFSKYVGDKFLAKRANGIKQYLSPNCIFDTVDEAVALVVDGKSLENYFSHEEYFSKDASLKQVNWLANNVL